MVPVQYNEDRFPSQDRPDPLAVKVSDDGTIIDSGPPINSAEVEEMLRRPDRKDEREYECNDVSPVDYGNGPHDKEFGVADHDFEEPDSAPVNYGRGPHDEEFGVEDDEELEPTGDEPEFPDI